MENNLTLYSFDDLLANANPINLTASIQGTFRRLTRLSKDGEFSDKITKAYGN